MSGQKEPGKAALAWTACKLAMRAAATPAGLSSAAAAGARWALGWVAPLLLIGALGASGWIAWSALPWIGALGWSALPSAWTSPGSLSIVESGKLAEPVWRSALLAMGASSDEAEYFAKQAGKDGPGEAAMPSEDAALRASRGKAIVAASKERREKAGADREARAAMAWIKAVRSGAKMEAAAEASARAEEALAKEQEQGLAAADAKDFLPEVALAIEAFESAKARGYGNGDLRAAMAPWLFASEGAVASEIRQSASGFMRFLGVATVMIAGIACIPLANFAGWLLELAEEAIERNRSGLVAQWERDEVERSAGKASKKAPPKRI